MSWLRSWKLCAVRRLELDGIPGWEKRRLRRAAWLLPPGNAFLRGIDAGCRMLGREWIEHECRVFRTTHPCLPPPRIIGDRLWLPHLGGTELRSLPAARLSQAALAAFAELGRFHRLGDDFFHGDPHAGNFLHDEESGSCRLIDFETTVPAEIEPADARARDFMLLALDLWRHLGITRGELRPWREAHGMAERDCAIDRLLHRPGFRLRCYWRWLGYRWTGYSG
jgi:hypothetical protein